MTQKPTDDRAEDEIIHFKEEVQERVDTGESNPRRPEKSWTDWFDIRLQRSSSGSADRGIELRNMRPT